MTAKLTSISRAQPRMAPMTAKSRTKNQKMKVRLNMCLAAPGLNGDHLAQLVGNRLGSLRAG